VAPQACVRVYARVLVPPNLYIHTCPYLQPYDNTHLHTSTTKTHNHTHTHTHTTSPYTTNAFAARERPLMYANTNTAKDVRPHDEMHCTIYLYTYVYSSYMSCAWPGVCCATSTAAALARRVRR